MRDLNNLNKNKKFGLKKKSGRVEKTIQIVKEREFVQSDEFNAAQDPMPDVTLREVKNSKQEKKVKNSAEKIKDLSAENGEKIKKSKKGNNSSKADKNGKNNNTDIKEIRRKEKNKKRLKKAAAFMVVIVFAAAAYGLRNLWIPELEGILDKPHDTIVNDGETAAGNFPLKVNENSVGEISSFNGYLVTLDDNGLCFYNEMGEEYNSFSHNYADPKLEIAEKRLLIYDNGGNSFKVVNKKSEFFEQKTDNTIIMAKIASNSYVAVVTQSDKYAAELTIYDNNGSVIYNWFSSSRILNVEFNNDATGCYVSTFGSDDGELKSTVKYILFNSTKVAMKSQPLDSIVFKVIENNDGDIWAIGDNKFFKLDKMGNVLLQYDYGSTLEDFDVNESCVCLVFKAAQRKTGEAVVFKASSDSQKPDKVMQIEGGYPKKTYVENEKIVILNDSKVEAYDFSGNLLATAEVSSEYVDFTFFNENIYFLGYREINKIAFST